MHVEASTGKDASGVFAQVASKALQRCEAAREHVAARFASVANPLVRWGVPDILQGILST